eukprot:COSAG02_NODE_10475_length_1933_cov_2.864776_2_plen_154_part_01
MGWHSAPCEYTCKAGGFLHAATTHVTASPAACFAAEVSQYASFMVPAAWSLLCGTQEARVNRRTVGGTICERRHGSTGRRHAARGRWLCGRASLDPRHYVCTLNHCARLCCTTSDSETAMARDRHAALHTSASAPRCLPSHFSLLFRLSSVFLL